MLRGKVLCDCDFPFIAVGQELFLVVQKLLVSFGCELVVRAFNDGINLKLQILMGRVN
jgi:hypothetical protein